MTIDFTKGTKVQVIADHGAYGDAVVVSAYGKTVVVRFFDGAKLGNLCLPVPASWIIA